MSTKRPSTPPPQKIDLNVVVLHDVEYFIYWDKVSVGASFFMPTTYTAKQVAAILDPVAEQLDYRLEVRNRCEYGRYGVRVWRTF